MKICIFGLWHLGSVTAAGCAKAGHTVTGLDFSRDTVRNLLDGRAPVAEPGLDGLIAEHLTKKTLDFTTDPALALQDTDALWIAFDTPVDDEDNADFGYIRDNFTRIAGYIRDGAVVIVSSQVPVGFTRQILQQFRADYPEKQVAFACSPENLRLGKALKTFLEPDRIVIGTLPGEKERFEPIFSPISSRLEWMGIESAEMTKHAINAYLATSICFANEIASVCEYTGADARDVERGLKTEERIGPLAYLTPGNAFSGGTLARDVRFLMSMGNEHNLPLHLVTSVLASNDYQKTWVRRRCREALDDLAGKNIAVLGLTYKPGTDTLRRSLAVELCRWLHAQGAVVTAFDPAIRQLPPEYSAFIRLSPDTAGAVRSADCIIVATEWPLFREMPDEVLTAMEGKVVLDPNGFLAVALAGHAGKVSYCSVGRCNP